MGSVAAACGMRSWAVGAARTCSAADPWVWVGKRDTTRPDMATFRPKLRRLGIAGSRTLFVWCGLLMMGALGGRVVVRPYQREQLAERCMAPGFGDKSEVKFRAHWEYARHGTQGGFGDDAGGGGCGCN